MAKQVLRWDCLEISLQTFSGRIEQEPTTETGGTIAALEIAIWPRGGFGGDECEMFAQRIVGNSLKCEILTDSIQQFEKLDDALDFVFSQLGGQDAKLTILFHSSLNEKYARSWIRDQLLLPDNQFPVTENKFAHRQPQMFISAEEE